MIKEQELMNTELLHWTPFIAGLPQLIFEVASTVLNSNYVDFSLEKSRQQFHYLKHVRSFRANLFEVRIYYIFCRNKLVKVSLELINAFA